MPRLWTRAHVRVPIVRWAPQLWRPVWARSESQHGRRYLYQDALGNTRGGITVSDKLGQKPSGLLFEL